MIDKQHRTVFETHRKSRPTAYLLWLLLGVVGVHRLYLRMKPSGFSMLSLVCVATATFLSQDLLGFTEAKLASTVT